MEYGFQEAEDESINFNNEPKQEQAIDSQHQNSEYENEAFLTNGQAGMDQELAYDAFKSEGNEISPIAGDWFIFCFSSRHLISRLRDMKTLDANS